MIVVSPHMLIQCARRRRRITQETVRRQAAGSGLFCAAHQPVRARISLGRCLSRRAALRMQETSARARFGPRDSAVCLQQLCALNPVSSTGPVIQTGSSAPWKPSAAFASAFFGNMHFPSSHPSASSLQKRSIRGRAYSRRKNVKLGTCTHHLPNPLCEFSSEKASSSMRVFAPR